MASRGVIAAALTPQGVERPARGGGDEGAGLWPLVAHGPPSAWLTRLARGHPRSQAQAGNGRGAQTDVAPALGGTMAFAWAERGHGGGIRLDDVARTALFAVGQARRVWGDLPRRGARGLQVAPPALARRLAPVGGLGQERCGLLGPGGQATAQVQHGRGGLAHPRAEAGAVAPAVAAQATPDLGQSLVACLRRGLQARGRARAWLAAPLAAVPHVFGAWDNVVASVTR